MLLHPTLDTLAQLRLDGMLKALQEQLDMPQIQTLSFEERLGLLLDRELSTRANRRLQTRLKQAKLREPAAIEDLDYRTHRGLDKALMSRLATGQCVAAGGDRLRCRRCLRASRREAARA
jgi:DNA replication protein DnaC